MTEVQQAILFLRNHYYDQCSAHSRKSGDGDQVEWEKAKKKLDLVFELNALEWEFDE